MKNLNEYNGYREDFLGKGYWLPFPELNKHHQEDIVRRGRYKTPYLHYYNYSVVISRSRRFPLFSACNINGQLFQAINRKDNWRKDTRIPSQFQWGDELYNAMNSNFDRGHMTRREEVQWGYTKEEAQKAANATFYYTNAVPQHSSLNKKIWKKLEDYILHSEAIDKKLKVSVFTGPILHDSDPEFTSLVEGKKVKLPLLFWKIVFYIKESQDLSAAAFIMGHEKLMQRDHIIKKEVIEKTIIKGSDKENLFMDFSEAGTFQVKVNTVEELAGIRFPTANESYKDSRPLKLVLKEVDAKGLTLPPILTDNKEKRPYYIEGITL